MPWSAAVRVSECYLILITPFPSTRRQLSIRLQCRIFCEAVTPSRLLPHPKEPGNNYHLEPLCFFIIPGLSAVGFRLHSQNSLYPCLSSNIPPPYSSPSRTCSSLLFSSPISSFSLVFTFLSCLLHYAFDFSFSLFFWVLCKGLSMYHLSTFLFYFSSFPLSITLAYISTHLQSLVF